MNNLGFERVTEIRHLRTKDRRYLANLLDIDDLWKDLASVIPKPDGEDGGLFSLANIKILEELKDQPGGSPTLALLDYWGTKGRQRPTLADLVRILSNMKLYRAANYVAVDLLNLEPVKSNSDANLDRNNFNVDQTSDTSLARHKMKHDDFDNLLMDLGQDAKPSAPGDSQANLLSCEDNSKYELSGNWTDEENCSQITYSELLLATNNFAATGSSKLGEGAFGSVFKACLSNGKHVAVKLLKNDFQKQFLSEIEVMVKFKHENLLPLYAVSSNGPSLCLVYDFMSNGSLLDRLSCLNGTKTINWKSRVDIARGTCKGLCYLHTFGEKPFVHRDIKSANILLDDNLVPKIGDFGLARIGSTGNTSNLNSKSAARTANVIGTTVYMAPEAFRGDVSIKLDSFSFGVVLLELLTSSAPYDESRDEPDILSFVEESIVSESTESGLDRDEFVKLLDPAAGQWDVNVAFELLKISRQATEQRKKNRLTMVQIMPLLEKLDTTL